MNIIEASVVICSIICSVVITWVFLTSEDAD